MLPGFVIPWGNWDFQTCIFQLCPRIPSGILFPLLATQQTRRSSWNLPHGNSSLLSMGWRHPDMEIFFGMNREWNHQFFQAAIFPYRSPSPPKFGNVWEFPVPQLRDLGKDQSLDRRGQQVALLDCRQPQTAAFWGFFLGGISSGIFHPEWDFSIL